MADTFFGFDPAQPQLDAEGASDDLDDYDALNDETFGSAINGDWEGEHENLVLLDTNGNTNGRAKDDTDDGDLGDLEFNIARMGLEDCEEVDDDIEARVQLDPSVWHPIKSGLAGSLNIPNELLANPINVPHPFQQIGNQQIHPDQIHAQIQQHMQIQQQLQLQHQQHQQHQQQQQQQQHKSIPNQMPNVPPMKIMSVEDIERNIRNQQLQQKSDSTAKPSTPLPNLQRRQPNNMPPFPPGLGQTSKMQPLSLQQQQLNVVMDRLQIDMGFNARFNTFNPPPQMNIMPPLPNAQQSQMHQNLARIPPNAHMPINNFIMNTNFNSIRTGTPVQMLQQLHQKPIQQPFPQPQMGQNMKGQPPILSHPNMPNDRISQMNQYQQNARFNARQSSLNLVHEIQQNHPMLPFNRINKSGTNHQHNSHHLNFQHRNNNNNNNNNSNNNNTNNYLDAISRPLNNQEYDEYANLMSQRDKQWLIGIQLSQLNTGTPYIDDFYYTVFKERRAKLKGIKENKAHKDNQLNHPLIQPKGHAQLVLISMTNKNGTNQQRNQRERKTSESNKDKETPRTYTPLQFENSLGKLQCGSVTAPRKIIDMDVVSSDTGSPINSTIEISTQRKSRQILLHIETLYRIALKLEDLENPTAIATSLIVKERKEKERLLALELERANEAIECGGENSNVGGNVLRPASSLSTEKEETQQDLLAKLLAGLTHEKVAQMMSIRKGKTLIKRILALIKDNVYRWEIWIAIFNALPALVKKDRDDSESSLFILFPEFQSYIENASIDSILRLTNTLKACEKLNYIFTNKFSISCAIVLLLKMESVYKISAGAISATQQAVWLEFLRALVDAAEKLGNAVPAAMVAFENDIMEPLLVHFSRFLQLKMQPLIVLLSTTIVNAVKRNVQI